MTQDEINQAEWQNPRNWRGGLLGIYSSARDTRVWVPKRSPWLGWTLNFAHPQSKWWLAGLVVGPVVLASVVGRVIR